MQLLRMEICVQYLRFKLETVYITNKWIHLKYRYAIKRWGINKTFLKVNEKNTYSNYYTPRGNVFIAIKNPPHSD